jgi:hypothetical protein
MSGQFCTSFVSHGLVDNVPKLLTSLLIAEEATNTTNRSEFILKKRIFLLSSREFHQQIIMSAQICTIFESPRSVYGVFKLRTPTPRTKDAVISPKDFS